MKQNKKVIVIVFVLMLSVLFAVSANAATEMVSIDFTGFDGSGFSSGAGAPPAGQLDSDMWAVTGFSDGDINFQSNCNSGDCARGTSTGGVGTGGIYAFNVGAGDMILGVQPGGSDFTPGTLTLRMRNNTGAVVSSVNVSYDIYYYNDQPRANSLNFAYSTDDSTYTPVPSEDFTTPEAADGSPAWAVDAHSFTLSGLSIPDNGLFYIQWQGDDVSGGGSRDEYGIDNITVTSLDPTAVSLQSFTSNNNTTIPILATILIALFALGTIAIWKRQQS